LPLEIVEAVENLNGRDIMILFYICLSEWGGRKLVNYDSVDEIIQQDFRRQEYMDMSPWPLDNLSEGPQHPDFIVFVDRRNGLSPWPQR
jgi:hypothetical protein